MTILQVVQKAALRVIGNKPDSAFAPNRDQKTVEELVDLANDVAVSMAESQDWQALTKIATITGDGTETQFDLPSDYDRMAVASSLVDPANWFWGYGQISTVNEWLRLKSLGYQWITPGAWIIIGNQFNFLPAPGASQQAEYPYITKNVVLDTGGTPKETFTTDTDTFRLDERTLTLGTIWRWKEQKGLEYAEDMQTYEIALSQRQAKDTGGRVIRNGPRLPNGLFSRAYPFALGPGT